MSEKMATGNPRLFISYANDNGSHAQAVRALWRSLRDNGIDAKIDVADQDERQNWPHWMRQQIDAADFVIVVASTAYRARSGQQAQLGAGLGVQREPALLDDRVYGNPEVARKILPVLLPGENVDGIPEFLGPFGGTRYTVDSFTPEGMEQLLRALTGQRKYPEPELGPVRVLPPADDTPVRAAALEPVHRMGVATSRSPFVIADVALHPEGLLTSIAFSPDGRRLAGCGVERAIRQWDLDSGRLRNPSEPQRFSNIRVLGRVGDTYAPKIAFSPVGYPVVSISWDVRWWDPATGRKLPAKGLGHSQSGNGITQLTFSPDGAVLAVGTAGPVTMLWDMTGESVTGVSITNSHRGVTSLAFSPDGASLATGGKDHTIQLWHGRTGRQISGPLTGHTGAVTAVAFSPDGNVLVSGSADGTVRLWHPRTHEPLGAPAHTPAVSRKSYSASTFTRRPSARCTPGT
jgi:hypothetical protein